MTARTTLVVESYTRSFVRSSGAVGVGSSFLTTSWRSSEPEETGVLERSLSASWGVRGGLEPSGGGTGGPSEESECSEPKECVMERRFFRLVSSCWSHLWSSSDSSFCREGEMKEEGKKAEAARPVA
jgi:hypothetical protein